MGKRNVLTTEYGIVSCCMNHVSMRFKSKKTTHRHKIEAIEYILHKCD